jgi:sugar O-acyltransferase (sialic acid O-acetyltransferase NeuD family)
MILFGVRTPLVVDYEESCRRLGIEIAAGISVSGTPRMLERSRIVTLDKLEESEVRAQFITCAFSSTRRRELCQLAVSAKLQAADALIDPTAILPKSVRVGVGTFINAGAVLGGACFIGDHVLINRAVSIGHHCIIGDFVSIGPGATLASNVRVEEGAVIGVGAVVVPNISIGRDAVIGAGSLIRRDVGEGIFVAGNPAVERPLDRKNSALNTEGEE